MKIIDIKNILGTDRDAHVPGGQGASRRLLLAQDGMGFSFHDTIIKAGAMMHLHYKNHIEVVYCVGGDGVVENLQTGERHEIRDGVMYILDKHDEHNLYGGEEDMRLICVFNPPLVGREIQDESGSFPLLTVKGGTHLKFPYDIKKMGAIFKKLRLKRKTPSEQ